MDTIVGVVIGVTLTAFFGLILYEYSVTRSEGRLKILRVEFFRTGGKGAYLNAVMVNKGKSPVIVDWVLLRDKQGHEEKRRPVVEHLTPRPEYLYPVGRLEIPFHLAQLSNEQLNPKDIVEFEAIDTLDKSYKYKLPRDIIREIENWANTVESAVADEKH